MNADLRHPELSAYLDAALAPAERAAVGAHIEGCALCRTRLAELRATSALIGRLPDLVPSRRLVPRLAGPPMWLAPLRTLTTFASGVSVFLFIASALLGNLNTLATTTGAAGNAPAASALSASAPERNSATGPVPAAGGLTQSSPSAADQAKVAGAPSAAPKPSSAFSDTSAPPQDAARADQVGPHADENAARARTIDAPALSNPWLWLALAIVLGGIAIALQRRLRSA